MTFDALKTLSGWRGLVGIGLAALVLPLAGCKAAAHAVAGSVNNDDPALRKKIVDSARNSCTTSASAKLPHTSVNDQRIASYCDCFATRGLGQFSNQEMAEIGMSGLDRMTPAQKGKLQNAIHECQAQVLGHPGS